MDRDEAEEYLSGLSIKDLKILWAKAGGIRKISRKENYIGAIWENIRGYSDRSKAIQNYRS